MTEFPRKPTGFHLFLFIFTSGMIAVFSRVIAGGKFRIRAAVGLRERKGGFGGGFMSKNLVVLLLLRDR